MPYVLFALSPEPLRVNLLLSSQTKLSVFRSFMCAQDMGFSLFD